MRGENDHGKERDLKVRKILHKKIKEQCKSSFIYKEETEDVHTTYYSYSVQKDLYKIKFCKLNVHSTYKLCFQW